MGKFNFKQSFYSQDHSDIDFIRNVDSLLTTEDLFIRAVPFYSNRTLKELFSLPRRTNRQINHIANWKHVDLFQLTYDPYHNSEINPLTGKFFTYSNTGYPDIHVAVTLENTDFFHKHLLATISGLYPLAMMTFLTHKKFRNLIAQFQESNNLSEVLIKKASHRFRVPEENNNDRIISSISWLGMEFREAFNYIYEQNGWFQSLQFQAKRNNYALADISLTRQGVLKTDGMFEQVFNSFIIPTCKTLHENTVIFGNRSRRDNKTLSVKPLAINFESEQFSDVSENAKFIKAMRGFKTASVSVLHGNPYLHLSITDYYDGSNFEVWVLNPKQIFIVPQLKGSVYAIKRLVNHIFDTYAEGEVVDAAGGCAI